MPVNWKFIKKYVRAHARRWPCGKWLVSVVVDRWQARERCYVFI